MATRTLSVAKQPDEFLSLVVAAGSIPGQRPTLFVSRLSEDAYNVVFDYLPNGRLTENPSYIGTDPDRPGYSQYSFAHGTVMGMYTCTGDHVILLDLRILGRVPAELTGLYRREEVA